jgi:hypothetical protein
VDEDFKTILGYKRENIYDWEQITTISLTSDLCRYPKRRAVSELQKSCFGGLEVACWSLVHKFAGSNPAEAVGFFRAKKSSARLS